MRLGFTLAVLLLSTLAHAQPIIGDRAPALNVLTLSDGGFSLSGRKGQVTIVDFSATWCGPCHQALAVLRALVAANPRLRLIVVDVNEPKAKVAEFYAGALGDKNLEVLLDLDGQAARTWGAVRFPTTFVLDDTGAIRHINRGFGSGYPDRLQGWVQGLLRP